MYLRLWGSLLALCALGLTVKSATAAPVYAPVKAAAFVPRDGMNNVLAKLQAGKEVRIAYFGGSITAANGWRPKTLAWFRQSYPKAKISEISASIGGTGSSLGAFRYGLDVLAKKPDLVFVEFAVNDGGDPVEQIWRNMEGIVRQTWKADPTIDLCFVYTFRVGYENDLKTGMNPRAASADEMLAAYYGIPSINVALPIVELAKAGKLIYAPVKDAQGTVQPTPEGVTLFSTDSVHPLDAGHELYAKTVSEAITAIAANAATPKAHTLLTPFIEDNAENAKQVPIDPSMLSAGWTRLSDKQGLGANFRSIMPILWEATKPGETITFKFKGTAAQVYEIMGPDGAFIKITLDGVARKPIALFDRHCTYFRANTLVIGDKLSDTVHTVTLEIMPEQPDRSSVVNIEKDKPGFDPKKYDGTGFRAAAILLRGEIVKD